MKQFITLSIIALSIFLVNPLSAQCDFPEGDFENWIDITADLTDDLPAGSIFLPEAGVPLIRLFTTFFIEGLVNSLLNNNTEPSIISQTLLGISRSEDASQGQFALKMAGDTLFNSADIYMVKACAGGGDELLIDFKHLGMGTDTLFVQAYLHNSTDLPVDENENFILEEIATYGRGSLIVNEEVTEYGTIRLNLTTNDVPATPDTLQLVIAVFSEIPTDGSSPAHFLFDNIRFTGGTTSTEDIDITTSIRVFPTLATDIITIESITQRIDNYFIYDANGKLIAQQNINNFSEQIDVSQFPEGSYVIKSKIGNKVSIDKFMKM